MGVTIDMRVVRSGQEIVNKVLARNPAYHAYEVTERVDAFVCAWNKHYVRRGSSAAQEHQAEKEERWKMRIKAANMPSSSHQPIVRPPKIQRGVTWIRYPGQ